MRPREEEYERERSTVSVYEWELLVAVRARNTGFSPHETTALSLSFWLLRRVASVSPSRTNVCVKPSARAFIARMSTTRQGTYGRAKKTKESHKLEGRFLHEEIGNENTTKLLMGENYLKQRRKNYTHTWKMTMMG